MSSHSEYIYQYPEYYDVLFGWDRSKEILFVDQLSQKHEVKGKQFLELACGTGVVARQLAFLGWDVMGLDLSKAMVDAMNKEMSVLENKIWAIHADMCSFSLANKFDLAYCPLGSLGLVHDDDKLNQHFKCMAQHLSADGIYVIDVGLQTSLNQPTKICDLNELVWAMEVEGIYVEATHGKILVEDDMKQTKLNLKWDAVPLEFNFNHLSDLILNSGLKIAEIYPQSGTTEEGIPSFNLEKTGYEEGIDRAMLVLSR